jgi:Na+-translocating ferredoxin:NAD+ oxidoreductase RNF subunit RnfB
MTEAIKYNAMRVNILKCFGCTHCLKVCPTEAIRIRNGRAVINDHRCVDCGNCKRICPADAFYIEQNDLARIRNFKYPVLLFPSVFIGQFPGNITELHIYKALKDTGFSHLVELEQPISILIGSIKDHISEMVGSEPFISSFCPAVNRLVQIKYPCLAGNIITRKPPHSLAALHVIASLIAQGATRDEIGIFYASPCTAKIAFLRNYLPDDPSKPDGIVNMKDLYNLVMNRITGQDEDSVPDFGQFLSKEGMLWSLPGGEYPASSGSFMAVDGIHEVVKILEKIENNDLPGIDFFELRSCQQGCAGGVLLSGSRFLTVERLKRRSAQFPEAASLDLKGIDSGKIRDELITDSVIPCPAFVYDTDRSKAIKKAMKAEKISCQLPGIDCGACGAPNCQALAEDMVQGQAKMTDCIFLHQRWQALGKSSPEKALRNIEKLWGKNRFEADCNKKGSRNEGY